MEILSILFQKQNAISKIVKGYAQLSKYSVASDKNSLQTQPVRCINVPSKIQI